MQSCSPVHEASNGVAFRGRSEAAHFEAADVEWAAEEEVVGDGHDFAVVCVGQTLQKSEVKSALKCQTPIVTLVAL